MVKVVYHEVSAHINAFKNEKNRNCTIYIVFH